LQLRYLQTLAEIATEHNSTIVFPLPIELLEPFLRIRQMVSGSQPLPSPAGNANPADLNLSLYAPLDDTQPLPMYRMCHQKRSCAR
jgi:hypothetical protein